MSATLSLADFGRAFQALYGYPPFPWQERLLESLVASPDGAWPEVLDLPTGSGKTAALDVALFHLGLQAHLPLRERNAALRIALVVDRRLIVDDVHARAAALARNLKSALEDPAAEPALRRWAAALAHLSGDATAPVQAVRLRGGMPLERGWARSLTQPLLISSTVDQLGSRLLWRGYGVSDRMLPVHAGLTGADTLVLLDEAHLAQPFLQSLHRIRALRGPAETVFQVATLTATKAAGEGRQAAAFQLDARDHSEPVLARRLQAAKPARLLATGQSLKSPQLVTEFVRESKTLLAELGPGAAIGIVVNRVALARAIFDRLEPKLDPEIVTPPMTRRVELLIGPARPFERDRIARDLERLKTGHRVGGLPQSTILVATQCIEAGVDLDLDGLVTQACPLDALRQRAGRVNRGGRDIQARIAILAAKEDLGTKDDPIYADRIRKTWDLLQTEGAGLDLGITAMTRMLEAAGSDKVRDCLTKKADAPVMLPAYIDLWRQTSPRPLPEPEIGLFLHGPERDLGSVQLLWRADVVRPQDKGVRPPPKPTPTLHPLSLLPPMSAESISLPLWTVQAWLRAGPEVPLADVPLADVPTGDLSGGEIGGGRLLFRWRGRDSDQNGWIQAEHIRAGDVVIAPDFYGGCDEHGWTGERTGQVRDLGLEVSAFLAERRFALRLHPDLLPDIKDAAERRTRDARFHAVLAEERESPPKAVLEALLPLLAGDDRLMAAGQALLAAKWVKLHFAYDPKEESDQPLGVVVVAERGLGKTGAQALQGHALVMDATLTAEMTADGVEAVTEDDALAAGGTGTLLEAHQEHVAAWVAVSADRLGLDPGLTRDLVLAARLHDLGKKDRRFQTRLMGGGRFAWDGETMRAKSPAGISQPPRPAPGAALTLQDLPPGWRHEVLSVQHALADPALAEAADPERVLWLIGSHHGLGRPFFGHWDPLLDLPEPARPEWLPAGLPPSDLGWSHHGQDWAGLFDRLCRRYGAWDLAWAEALLRLADHRASEAHGPPGAGQDEAAQDEAAQDEKEQG